MSNIVRSQMNSGMQQCVDNCLNCYEVCLGTVNYCLQKGGKHAEPAHIRLLLDCAEICQTCPNFMIRDSDLYKGICGACADICDRCAQSCERFGDDAQLKSCAELCRRCAESCRKMAA